MSILLSFLGFIAPLTIAFACWFLFNKLQRKNNIDLEFSETAESFKQMIWLILGVFLLLTIVLFANNQKYSSFSEGPIISDNLIIWRSTWALPFIVFWWTLRVFCTLNAILNTKDVLKSKSKRKKESLILIIASLFFVWVIPAHPSFINTYWRFNRLGIEVPAGKFNWDEIESIQVEFRYKSLGMWYSHSNSGPYEKRDDERSEMIIKRKSESIIKMEVPFSMAPDWDEKEGASIRQKAWRQISLWAGPGVKVNQE